MFRATARACVRATDVIPGALYKHYKGNVYQVIALAKDADTQQDMVVYERFPMYMAPIQEQQTYVRLLSVFCEDTRDVFHTVTPRFSLLDPLFVVTKVK